MPSIQIDTEADFDLDYSELAQNLDYSQFDCQEIASNISEESIASEIDLESLADNICLEKLAEAVVKKLAERAKEQEQATAQAETLGLQPAQV